MAISEPKCETLDFSPELVHLIAIPISGYMLTTELIWKAEISPCVNVASWDR